MKTLKSRTPMRRLSVVAALAVAFGAAFTTPALAHTRLVSSTPGNGATAASVSEVTLVFSDKISVADVVVKDGAQKTFQSGKAALGGTTVTQKLSGPLPAGSYSVAYGVVGEDGHRIEKADLKFTVGPGAEPVDPEQGQGDAATTGGVAAAEQTGAAATSHEKPLKADQEAEESGSGAMLWIMIVGGVLIGIAIGVLIVFRAKRKQRSAGSGE